MSSVEARLAKLEKVAGVTGGFVPCITVRTQALAISGELVRSTSGPRERHQCSDACVVVLINMSGDGLDPEAPDFREQLAARVKDATDAARRSPQTIPWSRARLEQLQKVCTFYGVDFPSEARDVVEGRLYLREDTAARPATSEPASQATVELRPMRPLLVGAEPPRPPICRCPDVGQEEDCPVHGKQEGRPPSAPAPPGDMVPVEVDGTIYLGRPSTVRGRGGRWGTLPRASGREAEIRDAMILVNTAEAKARQAADDEALARENLELTRKLAEAEVQLDALRPPPATPPSHPTAQATPARRRRRRGRRSRAPYDYEESP